MKSGKKYPLFNFRLDKTTEEILDKYGNKSSFIKKSVRLADEYIELIEILKEGFYSSSKTILEIIDYLKIRQDPDLQKREIKKIISKRWKKIKLGKEIYTKIPQFIDDSFEPVKTYFIKSKNHVRIGSSIDPEARLEILQIGNPEKLVLLGICYDSKKKIQEKFKEYNISGEWFELSDKIKKFIEQNTTK